MTKFERWLIKNGLREMFISAVKKTRSHDWPMDNKIDTLVNRHYINMGHSYQSIIDMHIYYSHSNEGYGFWSNKNIEWNRIVRSGIPIIVDINKNIKVL